MKFTQVFTVADWNVTINGNLKGIRIPLNDHGKNDPIVQLFEIRPDGNLELKNLIDIQVAVTPSDEVFIISDTPIPIKVIII